MNESRINDVEFLIPIFSLELLMREYTLYVDIKNDYQDYLRPQVIYNDDQLVVG